LHVVLLEQLVTEHVQLADSLHNPLLVEQQQLKLALHVLILMPYHAK